VFPLLFAAAQTTVGAEAYSIRYKNLTRARVELRLQEDDSFDTEFWHPLEAVGYLALGTPGLPGVNADAVFVAMGDSITFGIGDDISLDNFQNGTLPAGGYPPILTGIFASHRGKNVLVINEGIPGDLSADGLGDVVNIVNAYPSVDGFLLLYGANDAFLNVPSGLGLSPGQLGYLGSFKANMQQMINVIRSKPGKIPVLAKVLYKTSSTEDTRIQQYNQVINELVIQNRLTMAPPDFYTFFKANPNLLVDGVHPNDLGYRCMAQRWYNALVGLFP
jgi:lysophospholipase L1-like esterase